VPNTQEIQQGPKKGSPLQIKTKFPSLQTERKCNSIPETKTGNEIKVSITAILQ
jgi:hypothetical protein